MKLLRLLPLALVFVLSFISCTQDDPPATMLQRIQGQWTYQKDISYDVGPNGSHWDTTYADPGDYMDFRTDGKVYIKYDSEFDTTAYSLAGFDQIIFIHSVTSSDTFRIRTLSDRQLQIYVYDYASPVDIYENTTYLVR